MNTMLNIANVSYDIETYLIEDKDTNKIDKERLERLYDWANKKGIDLTMPENAEFIGAKYDPDTGTTVTLFRDNVTGEVKAGVTGTNFNAGFKEIVKDVGNWYDIANFGMNPYGKEVQFVLDTFNEFNVYPTEITGHSLGGCVAQLVGLRLQIDVTVFNSAPINSNFGSLVLLGFNPNGEYIHTVNKINELRDNYQGNYSNYITESDILSDIIKKTGSDTIGEPIILYEDTKKGNWFLNKVFDIFLLTNFPIPAAISKLVKWTKKGTVAHLTSAYFKHIGISVEDVETINTIHKYIKEKSIEIDINNDGIVDLEYDQDDFYANNLFTNSTSTTKTPVILVDQEGLNNFSDNLSLIANGEIQEVINVCDIALTLNDEIANKKNMRINKEHDNIKKFIESSILSDVITKISEITSQIQTQSSNDVHVFGSIVDTLKHGDYFVQTAFCDDMKIDDRTKAIYDKWIELNRVYDPDSNDNKLDSCLSIINETLNNKLSEVLEKVLKSINDIELNDVLVGLFSIEFNNLKVVSKYIDDELNQLSSFSKRIATNFENLDEGLAKNIANTYSFIEFENINKQENMVDYSPINNPNNELEQHIDNGLSIVEDSIIKEINDQLSDMSDNLQEIDLLFCEITPSFSRYIIDIKATRKITKEDVGYYLNSYVLWGPGSYCVTAENNKVVDELVDEKHICLFNELNCDQQQLINNLEKIFTPYMNLCSLYHTMDLYIYKDNKLTTYIKSRIKELIYEETNFDEQIAALVIIANKFNTISEELNQARIAIEQCEGSCFDEMILYIEDVLANINYFIESVDSLTEQNVVIR